MCVETVNIQRNVESGVDIMSLATKYRPKTFDDVTEQKLVVDILKKMCESELTNRNFLFIGPAGCGKAQPLTSKVLLDSGYVTMGDVKIGDTVVTGSGNRGKITGIYPQGVRPIYRITLQDRTYIDVSDEHLNVVYRYNENKKCREDFCLTTKDLISLFNSTRFKLRIDVPSVDWEDSELPVDPYLLGALIGDGSLSGNFQFSNAEEDVIDKVDSILRRDWGKYLKKCPGENVDYSISALEPILHKYTFLYKDVNYFSIQSIVDALVAEGYPKFDGETILRLSQGTATTTISRYPELADAISCESDDRYVPWAEGDAMHNVLNELGLLVKSSEKHIPEVYLKSSRDVRIALLQGLFDTDGYTDKSGATTFTTCSSQLSEDFAFLVRSLGIRDTVVSYPAKYKHNGEYVYTGTTAYDHNLKFPNDLVYCSSEKHLNRRAMRQQPPMRNIVSIEYIGDQECQCIMIDHPDHTYISDGFIPTHNTTTARIIANHLNPSGGNIIEVDAATYSGVEKTREILSQAKSYPIGDKFKIFIIDEVHALSSASFQAFLKVLEESPAMSVFMLCTTNPEKIPATILSRVQTFQLSKISLDGIVNRLKYVLDCEKQEHSEIEYADDAVQFIAKLSNGGMRDSLTLLDKALAFSPVINAENVTAALNLPSYDDYFAMLSAVTKHDNEKITALVDTVYNSGVNFVKWFEGFHAFVINIVKYIFLQDISKTVIPSQYTEKISKYTVAHSAVCLKLSQVLLKLVHELKATNYQQEIALTYLCSQTKGR